MKQNDNFFVFIIKFNKILFFVNKTFCFFTDMATAQCSHQFVNHLEAILLQKQLEKTVNDYYQSSIQDGAKRLFLLKQMIDLLKHRSFSPVMYFHRCPRCKGSLFLAEVDKGTAFVCGQCADTEELFMRHIYI